MGKRYEYRFHIDAFTPASMPMVHLAEYMAALAAFLGQVERVHFVRLEGGSTFNCISRIGLTCLRTRRLRQAVYGRLAG
jgi:hypothetical protein